MRVLVTGANGFIGKHLSIRIQENSLFTLGTLVRDSSDEEFLREVGLADAIVHLAGENRPRSDTEYDFGNRILTKRICDTLCDLNKRTPVIFASSQQALSNNLYGRSKKSAEQLLLALSSENKNPLAIYRLPGVFGKWCKPNYNSVVATFCNNIATGMPIRIDDPAHVLDLVYIDDVIDSFIEYLRGPFSDEPQFKTIKSVHKISLGDLAKQIRAFADSRHSLVSERVGLGFLRALYSTYVSYLPCDEFQYSIPCHADERGVFVEMLKTKDSGQFSFFTAHPGITRGGHYHHTKTEKFLVIKGNARFRFRHILTDELFCVDTSGKTPTIVETIPGWSHDITNNGDDELIVMLWANEIFDADKPDTIASIIANEKA